MNSRTILSQAVVPLIHGKDPSKKAVAESLNCFLHSLNFDHVDTNPEDLHCSTVYRPMITTISRTACSIPVMIARDTMLCPMLSSTR